MFAAKERLVFEIQIPEAMKLFKATEDRLPKSHEEFMERIVKENHIILPLLPEGHRYVYDPKRGELMVEQPARSEVPSPLRRCWSAAIASPLFAECELTRAPRPKKRR